MSSAEREEAAGTTRVAVVQAGNGSSRLFSSYLEANGFAVERLAADRRLGRALSGGAADIVVAHSAVNDEETLRTTADACRRLGTPFILIPPGGSDVERIMCLKMGADDVLSVPFSAEELVLRIRAILRRCGRPSREDRHTWALGDRRLSIHADSHMVLLDGRPLHLTEAQWRVLRYLATHSDAAVSRQQMMEQCLSYSNSAYDRAIDTHIKNLRVKLGDPAWIVTVRGHGYQFSWEAKKI